MSSRIRHCDIQVVNVKYILQCSSRMLDGKVKCVKKRAVMRSYSVLAINANLHYTECGMTKLLQASCKYTEVKKKRLI